MSAGACASICWSTRCFPDGCDAPGSSSGAAATAGCGSAGIGRTSDGWVCWSWWDETNAERGTRNAEQQGQVVRPAALTVLFRVPRSDFRVGFFGPMSIVVVLHEPQELVNIAHVVRALKNFGLRDLRLVNPREYDAYRVAGIAHQTQDVLAVTRGDDGRPFKAPRREGPAATAGELERLFADVEAALRVIEFFKTRQAEGVMRTVREVIHRTPLDEREAKLVRAMAIEVVKYGERLARSRVHVDR